MIIKEKNKVNIFNDVYNIENLEFIYTKNNNLVVCTNTQTKEYACLDAPKKFREIATAFIICGLDNFVVLLSGNNMVNVNAIKNLSVNMDNLTIQTNNHQKTIFNTGGFDYICLKGKLPKQNKEDLLK